MQTKYAKTLILCLQILLLGASRARLLVNYGNQYYVYATTKTKGIPKASNYPNAPSIPL